MALKNACFISYRHPKHDRMSSFTRDFHAALASELEPLVGDDRIGIDWTRLEAASALDAKLAAEVCSSACLIAVYVPTYFNNDSGYCAREFAAMLSLEEQRRAVLKDRTHRLVLVVALNGFATLPSALRGIVCHDFEDYRPGGAKMSRSKKFQPKIKVIADYVAKRFHELKNAPPDCGDFQLPAMDDPRVISLIGERAGNQESLDESRRETRTIGGRERRP